MASTSRLDRILDDTGTAIAEGIVTGNWRKIETKEQIKLLFLEVIDQAQSGGCRHSDTALPNELWDETKRVNSLKALVEAL